MQQLIDTMRAPVQQPPAPPPALPTRPTGEDFMLNPEQATRRLIEYEKAATFAPAFAQNTEVLAQQTRAIAELQHADAFKRWPGEIDKYLAGYPVETRANPKAWELAVKQVMVDHLDELATERAEAKMKASLAGATLTPHGAPGASGTMVPGGIDLGSDQIPARFKAVLSQRGITTREVDEFLRMSQPDVPREQAWTNYIKQLEGGDILTDGREMKFVKGADTGAAVDPNSPYVKAGWNHVRNA